MNTLGLVFYLRLVKDDSNVRRDSSLYLSKKLIATPSPYFLILSETQRTQGREREREVTNKTSSVVLARGQDSKGTLLSGWWKLSSSLILLKVFIYSLCIAKTCTSLWTQTSAGQPISPREQGLSTWVQGPDCWGSNTSVTSCWLCGFRQEPLQSLVFLSIKWG